jgi:16S rRNA G1207 methylase RsmC
MRGGFYPAPAEAIVHAATFLRPSREPFTICDPCCGQGAAIKRLGELLGCPQCMIYAIELDDSRAQKVRDTLPQAHVLAPASFFGCRATPNSFSMIYLNPPFDDNYAGGRMEIQFLQTATHWLMLGGVMALVCPEGKSPHVVRGTSRKSEFVSDVTSSPCSLSQAVKRRLP